MPLTLSRVLGIYDFYSKFRSVISRLNLNTILSCLSKKRNPPVFAPGCSLSPRHRLDRSSRPRNGISVLAHLRIPEFTAANMTNPADDRRIQAIERPDSALWTYYLLRCLVFPPIFPIIVLPMYFRYHTMRYHFSDDGISMSWGILFRRQSIVNYARIQDIHLKSNIVERWLGLARILVQTASGAQSAELTIEGIKDFELLRDFLYARMRGVKDGHANAPATAHVAGDAANVQPERDELTLALREVTRELRAVRELLGARQGVRSEERPDV
jgi:membrane protein YdbS with pleckstrin-like domain